MQTPKNERDDPPKEIVLSCHLVCIRMKAGCCFPSSSLPTPATGALNLRNSSENVVTFAFQAASVAQEATLTELETVVSECDATSCRS
jgi:hypothetical protein